MRVSGIEGCCGARHWHLGIYSSLQKSELVEDLKYEKRNALGEYGLAIVILNPGQKRLFGSTLTSIGFKLTNKTGIKNPRHGHAGLFVYILDCNRQKRKKVKSLFGRKK